MTVLQPQITSPASGSDRTRRAAGLQVGAWCARTSFMLGTVYAAVMAASGAATSTLHGQHPAIAEVLVIVLVLVLVTLMLRASRTRERLLRMGRLAARGRTLAGLIGPVVGHADRRVVGLLGYGSVFPVIRLLIGSVLLRAAEASAGPSPTGRTPVTRKDSLR